MDGPETPALDLPPQGPEVVRVLLRRLDPELPTPGYACAGDAGADLRARHDARLPPGGRATVATGVAVALPEGYAAFVHPRSGLAAHHGVTTLNGPGTVDAGYRGELLVTLVNTDRERAFAVRRGDRIAQLVVQRVARAAFAVVDELPGSDRGAAGHGSTGGWSAVAPRPPSRAVHVPSTTRRAASATVAVAAERTGPLAGPSTGSSTGSPEVATGAGRSPADRRTTETSWRAGAAGEEKP